MWYSIILGAFPMGGVNLIMGSYHTGQHKCPNIHFQCMCKRTLKKTHTVLACKSEWESPLYFTLCVKVHGEDWRREIDLNGWEMSIKPQHFKSPVLGIKFQSPCGPTWSTNPDSQNKGLQVSHILPHWFYTWCIEFELSIAGCAKFGKCIKRTLGPPLNEVSWFLLTTWCVKPIVIGNALRRGRGLNTGRRSQVQVLHWWENIQLYIYSTSWLQ